MSHWLSDETEKIILIDLIKVVLTFFFLLCCKKEIQTFNESVHQVWEYDEELQSSCIKHLFFFFLQLQQ